MTETELHFLGGDSYPADRHVEEAVFRRLRHDAGIFVSQADIDPAHGVSGAVRPVEERVDLLLRRLRGRGRHGRTVLIGRSSGCRVATLCAEQALVDAVICFSYPFRRPGRPLEPCRFAHLAELRTPTLMIQGRQDEYGGGEVASTYCLSEHVALQLIPGVRHDFVVTDRQWDRLAGQLGRFIRSQCEAAATPLFDEAYYLQTYRDVADAVRARAFRSGAHHYREQGRPEGRRPRCGSALLDDGTAWPPNFAAPGSGVGPGRMAGS